jgi:hypothetical protein
MQETKQYDKKSLRDLRMALPFGGVKLLAQKANCSTMTIQRFFKGEMAITDKNIVIAAEAVKLIQDYQNRAEKTKAELMACLKNSKPSKPYTNAQ